MYESKRWRFVIPEPDEEIGLRMHMRPFRSPRPPIGVAGVAPSASTARHTGDAIECLADNVFVVGSVDGVARQLRETNDTAGGFGTLPAMGHEWDAAGRWEASMRLLAEDVMPQV